MKISELDDTEIEKLNIEGNIAEENTKSGINDLWVILNCSNISGIRVTKTGSKNIEEMTKKIVQNWSEQYKFKDLRSAMNPKKDKHKENYI